MLKMQFAEEAKLEAYYPQEYQRTQLGTHGFLRNRSLPANRR